MTMWKYYFLALALITVTVSMQFPQTQRQDVPDGPDQTTQPVRLNVSDVPGTPNGNNRSNDQGPPSLIKFGHGVADGVRGVFSQLGQAVNDLLALPVRAFFSMFSIKG